MSDNLVTMTFEMDQDVYYQATKVCKQLGTTIEIMAESIIKFCVVPENLPILEAFINRETEQPQIASDEDVLSVSYRLLTKNKDSYESLAK